MLNCLQTDAYDNYEPDEDSIDIQKKAIDQDM